MCTSSVTSHIELSTKYVPRLTDSTSVTSHIELSTKSPPIVLTDSSWVTWRRSSCPGQVSWCGRAAWAGSGQGRGCEERCRWWIQWWEWSLTVDYCGEPQTDLEEVGAWGSTRSVQCQWAEPEPFQLLRCSQTRTNTIFTLKADQMSKLLVRNSPNFFTYKNSSLTRFG